MIDIDDDGKVQKIFMEKGESPYCALDKGLHYSYQL